MNSSKVYTINRGINKPIEFRGLKAQYIVHLAGAMVGMLIGFAVLHMLEVSAFVSVPLALGLGGTLTRQVYRMSKQYGQYGWMKKRARKGIPCALRSRSRKIFIKVYHDNATSIRRANADPGSIGGLHGK